MKLLVLLLIAVPVFASSPQEKYADEVAKAKVDYNRAVRECKAMPVKEKVACQKRVERTWQDVQKGLRAQHMGSKT